MDHKYRSVLKDVNSQQNMNTPHINVFGIKAEGQRQTQNLQDGYESSSSEDYRSAEEDDVEFNSKLDSIINGFSKVHILTPKAKKLKTQLHKTFNITKTIDPNLSQQLAHECTIANHIWSDQNNPKKSEFEDVDESYASLLNESSNEAFTNIAMDGIDTIKENVIQTKVKSAGQIKQAYNLNETWDEDINKENENPVLDDLAKNNLTLNIEYSNSDLAAKSVDTSENAINSKTEKPLKCLDVDEEIKIDQLSTTFNTQSELNIEAFTESKVIDHEMNDHEHEINISSRNIADSDKKCVSNLNTENSLNKTFEGSIIQENIAINLQSELSNNKIESIKLIETNITDKNKHTINSDLNRTWDGSNVESDSKIVTNPLPVNTHITENLNNSTLSQYPEESTMMQQGTSSSILDSLDHKMGNIDENIPENTCNIENTVHDTFNINEENKNVINMHNKDQNILLPESEASDKTICYTVEAASVSKISSDIVSKVIENQIDTITTNEAHDETFKTTNELLSNDVMDGENKNTNNISEQTEQNSQTIENKLTLNVLVESANSECAISNNSDMNKDFIQNNPNYDHLSIECLQTEQASLDNIIKQELTSVVESGLISCDTLIENSNEKNEEILKATDQLIINSPLPCDVNEIHNMETGSSLNDTVTIENLQTPQEGIINLNETITINDTEVKAVDSEEFDLNETQVLKEDVNVDKNITIMINDTINENISDKAPIRSILDTTPENYGDLQFNMSKDTLKLFEDIGENNGSKMDCDDSFLMQLRSLQNKPMTAIQKEQESKCDNILVKIDESVTDDSINMGNTSAIIGSPNTFCKNEFFESTTISNNLEETIAPIKEANKSPKASTTSIFKWIGNLLSPGKGITQDVPPAVEDNVSVVSDNKNNTVTQKSFINDSKTDGEFACLSDETPIAEFMSVSTTSEPFNESRGGNDENSELLAELEQLRNLAKENEKKIESIKQEINDQQKTATDLEENTKKLEKELEILSENEKISEQAITGFEKRITEMRVENEQLLLNSKEQLEQIKVERDSSQTNLSTIENAFSTLHKKYEQCKKAIETMKSNQTVLQNLNSQLREIAREQDLNLSALQEHATKQIETAKADYENTEHQHKVEMIRWTALIKKAELQKTSLEEAVEKKKQENAELLQLCDVLIQKVG